jgi:hypothetical protein
LVWKRDGDAVEAFRDRLVGDVGRRLLGGGALRLIANVSDLREQVGKGTSQYLGEGKKIAASVSVWVDSIDVRGALEDALRGIAARVDGSRHQSMPLRCPRLARRRAAPGVTLWTAFPKPERITDEVFYGRWHGHHTPLVRDPPLWEYTNARRARSDRRRAALPDPSGRPHPENLLDPPFFGASENIQRVLTDIATFSDFETINTAPMSEFILKS